MCHQFVTGEWMVTAVDVAKASAVAAQSSGGCGYRRRRVSAGWAWSTCRRLILHASPSRASRCEWRVAPSVFSRKLREERNSPRRASKCICNRGVMQQPLVPRRQPREARANRKRRVRLPRAASGVVADVIEWPLTCIWPHRGTKGRNLWGWGGGRVCWDRQDFRFMLAQLSFLSVLSHDDTATQLSGFAKGPARNFRHGTWSKVNAKNVEVGTVTADVRARESTSQGCRNTLE